jgi:hypothetical protein
VRAGELNDPNAYTVLSPRQQVTPTPYAIYAKNAGTVSGGITGSGTGNRIAKFTTSNTIGNAAIYENSQGRIGIRGAPFWGSGFPGSPGYGPDLHVNAADKFVDVWLGDANSTNGAKLGQLSFVGYGGGLWPPERTYAAITGLITDSGQYHKGALSFYTATGEGLGGTTFKEQMRITNSGKVGIGTTNPQTDLHVHGSVGAIRMTNPTTGITNGLQLGFITDNSVDAAVWNTAGGGYLKFGTVGYERMRITADGKVGIRTDAPTGILHVAGGTAYSGQDGLGITLKAEDGYSVNGLYGDGTDGGDIILMPGLGGNGGWFSGADGEPGGVGIGTTNPGTYKLYVAGTAYSTGGWQSSDLRFKKNIETIDSPLEKIMNIKGVSFEWKTSEYKDKGFSEGRHYGVIAQDVEQVLPQIVKEGPDGEKAVSYTELIPILTEAIKEQQKQIDSLRSEVKFLQETIQQHQFNSDKKVQQ